MYEREGTSRYNIRKNYLITGLRFGVGPKLDPENDTKGQMFPKYSLNTGTVNANLVLQKKSTFVLAPWES
jgi:hypothetical protein